MVQLTDNNRILDENTPMPCVNPIPRRGPPSKAVLALSIASLQEATRNGNKMAEQLLLQHQSCKQEQSQARIIRHLFGQTGPVFKTYRVVQRISEEPEIVKLKVLSAKDKEIGFEDVRALQAGLSERKPSKPLRGTKKKVLKFAAAEAQKAESSAEQMSKQEEYSDSQDIRKELPRKAFSNKMEKTLKNLMHLQQEAKDAVELLQQESKEEEKVELVQQNDDSPPSLLNLKIPLPSNSDDEAMEPPAPPPQPRQQVSAQQTFNPIGNQSLLSNFIEMARIQQLQREIQAANLINAAANSSIPIQRNNVPEFEQARPLQYPERSLQSLPLTAAAAPGGIHGLQQEKSAAEILSESIMNRLGLMLDNNTNASIGSGIGNLGARLPLAGLGAGAGALGLNQVGLGIGLAGGLGGLGLGGAGGLGYGMGAPLGTNLGLGLGARYNLAGLNGLGAGGVNDLVNANLLNQMSTVPLPGQDRAINQLFRFSAFDQLNALSQVHNPLFPGLAEAKIQQHLDRLFDRSEQEQEKQTEGEVAPPRNEILSAFQNMIDSLSNSHTEVQHLFGEK